MRKKETVDESRARYEEQLAHPAEPPETVRLFWMVFAFSSAEPYWAQCCSDGDNCHDVHVLYTRAAS